MRTLILRTICVVLLLCFGLMFSGVALFSIAASPTATCAITNHCAPDGAQSSPVPCTKPACPLCKCAIADAVQPVEILTTFHYVCFDFKDIEQLAPDQYVVEIFHPPRLEGGFEVV